MPRAATFSPPLHTFKTMATFLLFLFWLNILPKEVSSAPSQFANPLLCSFSDNAAGFYASWHSNCSGLVNFIVNVRNFPRPDLPTFGFFRDSLFGHFWTGIGFKLISTQMALIENLSGAFVSVTPARLDHGLPPIREIGAGILINPRGSFVGSTLEATFAIDESLFGTGCREFMFFTALTPIGAPYGAVPFSKTICDVARTCSRYKCDDFGKKQSEVQISAKNNSIPSSSTTGFPVNTSTSSPPSNVRQKRQTSSSPSSISGFSSLQGTAYEGQDQAFQREPPVPAVNTRYAALDDWRARGGGAGGRWTPIEQRGMDQTQMYWPMRTIIGGENGRQPSGQYITGSVPPSDATFFDPAKCDGGVDPQWCAEHVRQFVNGFGTANRGKQALCPSLLDSIRTSDHHCCNALRQMGC